MSSWSLAVLYCCFLLCTAVFVQVVIRLSGSGSAAASGLGHLLTLQEGGSVSLHVYLDRLVATLDLSSASANSLVLLFALQLCYLG